MKQSVKDRVVIVTGASAGIGRATVVLLAQAGARVVATARRQQRLESLAAEQAQAPGEVIAVAGDIREEAFAGRLVAETLAAFGRIDVLVNNAGVGHRSFLAQTPAADMRAVMDTNLLGLLYATQAVLPAMRRQQQGQIVNISSIVGVRPLPKSAVYCASKAAVNFVSRSLRMELRADNIRVTLVYPGLTTTEFAHARLGEKGLNRFGIQGIPAERVAQAIVRAIERGRQEVYISWYDRLFSQLNRLFPGSIDWVAGRASRLA